MRLAFVLLAITACAVAQPPVQIAAAPPGADLATVAANMQKFVEWYGLATQIMNLGGSFIGTNGASSGSKLYGNEVYNDVRPAFRGVRNYEPEDLPPPPPRNDGGILGLANLGLGALTGLGGGGGGGESASSASEYGGGPLGGSGSAARGGLESLINGFLGSSVDSPPPPVRSRRTRNLYDADGASNIDGILNALMRSGAQPAEPAPTGNILSQLFGKK